MWKQYLEFQRTTSVSIAFALPFSKNTENYKKKNSERKANKYIWKSQVWSTAGLPAQLHTVLLAESVLRQPPEVQGSTSFSEWSWLAKQLEKLQSDPYLKCVNQLK